MAQQAQGTGLKSTVDLVKKISGKKDFESIDMLNMRNMAYEGSFWFGQPAQKMQVIFDTGSAWAWLFSQ